MVGMRGGDKMEGGRIEEEREDGKRRKEEDREGEG